MKSKILIQIYILILICTSSSALFAREKILGVNPALIEAAMQGKKMMFQRKYSAALNHFQKIQADYPDSITGLFGQMAVWQVRMFENDDFRFASKYNQAEKEFEKYSLRQLRKGGLPSWELFVHGAADGMRGFFKGRQGKWMSSLSHGLHAMRMFKQLKFQEPNFVDTDLGFGMYKFWRSVFTNEIKFLPFFSDQRPQGLKLVQNVAKNGKYSRDMAQANLIFMYGQENRHDMAIQTANKLLAIYPNNVIIKYQKGRNLLWAKKYDEALKSFEDIYKAAPSITKALYQQGVVLFRKKEYERSKATFEKFLTVDKSNEYNGYTYYYLGRIAEVNKDEVGAIELYKKALSLYKVKAAKTRLGKLSS